MEKSKARRGLTLPREKAFTILYRLGQEISPSDNSKTLPSKILSLLRDEGGFEHCCLFLWDKEGNLGAVAALGCRAGQKGSLAHPFIRQMAEKAIPHLVPDVRHNLQAEKASFFSTGSMLLAPLVTAGKGMGVLVLEREKPRALSPSDRNLLTLFAIHLAAVLRIAQLHHEFQAAAWTDSLTGVHNQAYFYLRLEEELSLARRRGRPLSIALSSMWMG